MTISANSDYILEHPFLKQAIANFNRGDIKDLKYLISEIHIHTWLTVSNDCAVAFRQNKRLNNPEILSAIRDIPPPVKLSLHLPIPLKTEECKVVALSTKTHPIKNHKIANQLEFDFTIKTKRPRSLVALVG